ncbi:putative Fe-S oxidoreductase [Hyella patelloides LEGE 07179]|uniref:Putative Fe-S oxidoreductase n=1 Tax=Hyella patelloides LEGE 07179 TaxID=945734 RepID=A0A563VML9_9CYAN|nr:YkgJ family cysteine cluster protein [Hyella patelloides]VEP12662.1 putative Fe-S oxidoreductase [Hyella patelloides LEGE 07179]
MKTIKETWCCVANCGACCNLTPEDRPDLEEYLTAEELEIYLGMVGKDGWCINLDKDTRKCLIYEQRPRFCRVKPDTFQDMYDVAEAEFNEFAIACCRDQISGVYGNDSVEMKQYNRGVRDEE